MRTRPPSPSANTIPRVERAVRERRVLLPWRIAFIVYALAMMVGIHWPQLRMAVADVPAPDKIIHFLAFGALGVLLWSTGWVRGLPLIWLIVLAWAYLAELTQSIPILGRTFSWWDIIAGWLGASVFILWLWALGPVGGAVNRLRLRMNSFIIQDLFTRPQTWLLSAITSGAVATAIGGSIFALLYWFDPTRPRDALTGAILGAAAGGLAGLFGNVDRLTRRSRDEIAARQPCFECGASCSEAEVNDAGWGACPRCGARFHLGQWVMRAEMTRPAAMRLALRAGSFALLLALAAVVLYITLILTHRHVPEALASIVRTRGMPGDMRLSIDVAVAGLIAALAVRAFRRDAARAVDRQSERCRACGHDVHATPVERGLGRCGECGTAFMRG